jgi:hypothetical protein
MKRIGTRLAIRERGKEIRYAPSTPAMAPLAPIVGTWLVGTMKVCKRAAATPLNK